HCSGAGVGQRQFVWFDRSGREVGDVGAADTENSIEPALSPDGRRVAVRRTVKGNTDIWFSRRRSGRVEPVYVGCRPETNPTWSPDGKRMVFGSVQNGEITNLTCITAGQPPRQSELTSRQARWTHVRRCVVQHEGLSRMYVDEQVRMRRLHACTRANKSAQVRYTRAEPGAGLHA